MIQPAQIGVRGEVLPLLGGPEGGDRLAAELVEGVPFEVEIGFGKGRYLLRRAAAEPERRFVGIELVGQYFRLVVERAARRGLDNLVALRGEAQMLLAAVLPEGRAQRLHVYFPDPWPKDRHARRRLFDETSIDLLLRALCPGGVLEFASDHPRYGPRVRALLESHPALSVERVDAWPDGARTNYEAKYEREGRSIVRLRATRRADPRALREPESLIHPSGRRGLACAYRWQPEDAEPDQAGAETPARASRISEETDGSA